MKESKNYSIRQAIHADLEILFQFNLAMAKETENLDLPEDILRKGIKAGLDDPHRATYFVAIDTMEIVGSLMITPEWSDWRNSFVAWIQSVYIKPSHRRKGVYAALYQHIVNLVNSTENYGGIRLYVDKTNTNAIKTYSALGMNGEHYQLFEKMKNY